MPEEELKLSLRLWQPTLLERGRQQSYGHCPHHGNTCHDQENRISDGDGQVLELRAALITVPSCGHKLGPSRVQWTCLLTKSGPLGEVANCSMNLEKEKVTRDHRGYKEND